MKRFSCVAIVAAILAAAPAFALPNAFWTFGWDFPAQDRPWTIGDASDRGPTRRAAIEGALAGEPAPVFAFAPIEPTPRVFAIEPVAAIVLAGVDQRSTGEASATAQPMLAVSAPEPVPEPAQLAYDLAGL